MLNNICIILSCKYLSTKKFNKSNKIHNSKPYTKERSKCSFAYNGANYTHYNLFPIPMLDGGHLMFYAFEKVLGRPLSQKTQEGFFRIGLFLLLSLMFFTTFNDLKDLGLFR